MTLNEWLLLTLNVSLACLLVSHLGIVPAAARRWIDQLLTARGIPLVFLVACSLGLCFGVQLRHGPPLPKIHDEFSYLLAGDTFASLRWSNPPHACWPHFETMHVLQQPAYTSKYPPGQGIVLAIGSLLGAPVFGVWLSLATACGAVWWMLRAWVGAGWALTGGLLAAVRLSTADYPGDGLFQQAYWSHSYWGGAVAALAGGLVLGGIWRLVQSGTRSAAAMYALGLGVLAISRPFEGLLLSLPTLIPLGLWTQRNRLAHGWATLFSTLSPAGLVLGAFAAVIGWHNLSTTGQPLRMPYAHYQDTYVVTPMTLLQPLDAEPDYRHAEMREFHAKWEVREFSQQLDLNGYIEEKSKRLGHLWEFYVGGLLSLPLLVGLLGCRDRWTGLAIVMISLPLVAHAITPWMHPHYLAPAFAPLLALIVQGLRTISRTRWLPFRLGVPLAATLVLLSVFGSLASMLESKPRRSNWEAERQRVEQQLQQTPGKHLAIVRYGPGHSHHQEWVYNRADIDAAKIVWARDMGEGANQRLVDYFSDRRQWLLEVSGSRATLSPYPDRSSASSEALDSTTQVRPQP